MSRYQQGDQCICHCCRLPTCVGATAGIGRICPLCLAHYGEAFGVHTDPAVAAVIAADHEEVALAVSAVEDYFARHQGQPFMAAPVTVPLHWNPL